MQDAYLHASNSYGREEQSGSGGRSVGSFHTAPARQYHPSAPNSTNINISSTYLTPLRDAPSSVTTIHANSGLRSRTRSRSPSKEPQAIRRNSHTDGVGGGSIAIGIDGHHDGDDGDDIEGYPGSNHERISGGDETSVISSATKSSALRLKRAASSVVTLKRRTGQNGAGGHGDRLPLYHPNQYRIQSYTNTQYHYRQQQHPVAQASSSSSWLAHAAFVLVVLYVMLDSHSKVDRSTAHLEYYREEESRVNAKIAAFEERVRHLILETDRLRRENEVLEERRFDADADADAGKERRLLLRDSTIPQYDHGRTLRERLRVESRRDVTAKFGSGRHVVEIDLIFPDEGDMEKTVRRKETLSSLPTKFQVEMASLADVPHAVQLFLEQVHHGLWDGCAFVWNPDHLVLAR